MSDTNAENGQSVPGTDTSQSTLSAQFPTLAEFPTISLFQNYDPQNEVVRLRGELSRKTVEINNHVIHQRRLRQDIAKIEKSTADVCRDYSLLQERYLAYLRQSHPEAHDLAWQNETFRETIRNQEKTIGSHSVEMNDLDEQLEDLVKQNSALETERDTANANYVSLESKFEDEEKKHANTQTKLEQEQEEHRTTRNALNKFRGELEDEKKELTNASSRVLELEGIEASLRSQLDEANTRNTKLDTRVRDRNQEIQDQTKISNDLINEGKLKDTKITTLEEQIGALETLVADHDVIYQELQSERAITEGIRDQLTKMQNDTANSFPLDPLAFQPQSPEHDKKSTAVGGQKSMADELIALGDSTSSSNSRSNGTSSFEDDESDSGSEGGTEPGPAHSYADAEQQTDGQQLTETGAFTTYDLQPRPAKYNLRQTDPLTTYDQEPDAPRSIKHDLGQTDAFTTYDQQPEELRLVGDNYQTSSQQTDGQNYQDSSSQTRGEHLGQTAAITTHDLQPRPINRNLGQTDPVTTYDQEPEELEIDSDGPQVIYVNREVRIPYHISNHNAIKCWLSTDYEFFALLYILFLDAWSTISPLLRRIFGLGSSHRVNSGNAASMPRMMDRVEAESDEIEQAVQGSGFTSAGIHDEGATASRSANNDDEQKEPSISLEDDETSRQYVDLTNVRSAQEIPGPIIEHMQAIPDDGDVGSAPRGPDVDNSNRSTSTILNPSPNDIRNLRKTNWFPITLNFLEHCAFYYLFIMSTLTVVERSHWLHANEATRALLSDMLAYRANSHHPGRDELRYWVPERWASGFNMGMLSVAEFFTYELKGYRVPG